MIATDKAYQFQLGARLARLINFPINSKFTSDLESIAAGKKRLARSC